MLTAYGAAGYDVHFPYDSGVAVLTMSTPSLLIVAAAPLSFALPSCLSIHAYV